MKLFICDECRRAIVLTGEWQNCGCGKVGGKNVENGIEIIIAVKNKETARILDIPESVVSGGAQEGKVSIIPWASKAIIFKKNKQKA
ncbi:MAG: hypothetical protein PHF10_04360 [Patescibacteria group bacterium]|nr:hypothetical protein [Patescibacteria group bacterium]MDD5534954.1 hypothetical protein [Patescibacteria group bacterium]